MPSYDWTQLRSADCRQPWKELEPAAKRALREAMTKIDCCNGSDRVFEAEIAADEDTDQRLRIVIEYRYTATLRFFGRKLTFFCIHKEVIPAVS